MEQFYGLCRWAGSRFGSFLALATCIWLIAASVASAQSLALTPAEQNGVNWLTAQVQSDGSLHSESASIATVFQARQEALLALSSLATAPASLVSSVAADADANVEYTARRIIAAGAQAQPTDLTSLIAMQNADGGWGLDADFQSDPLDSAFALIALASANNAQPAVVSSGLSYLSQAGSASGGWGVNGQGSVYVTSYVILAANAYATQYPVASITSSATTWLLSQRAPATQTFAQTLDNALALHALATQTAQSAVLQPIVTALNSRQLSDGSWADDPYITALALRGLWFASQPPSQPTTGDVQGKVIDQSTGQSIAGATVQLAETPALGGSTGSDGSFSLSGVSPGTYTLRVSQLGYKVSSTSIQIVAGQVLNVGTIQLVPAPLTANLSGVIKSSSGTPLQKAIISVGTSTAFTDINGAYQITGLSPGNATITASLSGYQTVTATVSFVAGNSYLFSPTLYANGQTVPGTSLQGIVIDGASSKPISGATVTLNGANQTTDINGKFVFTNATAGSFAITISATNYQTVTATGTLVAGVNDVGKIALTLAPQTSTLSGTVTDADTKAPVSGAVVSISGQSLTSTSDVNGKYSIPGIAGAQLTIVASSNGYLTQTLAVVLPQIGPATLDVALTKPTHSGLSFTQVVMDKSQYNPNDAAELHVQLANNGASAISVVVQGLVFDSAQNVSFTYLGNVTGLGVPPANLPVVVPANGVVDLDVDHTLLRQAAGNYTVKAQALDGNGVVIAEGGTTFSVQAEAVLAGGLTPNPPLAQVGTQQPIQLTADLTNLGNQTIAAGNLNLAVTLENADTSASNVGETSVKTLTSGSPFNQARGLVRDASGNLYTVNYGDGKLLKIDPTGAISVLAVLPTSAYPAGLAMDSSGNFWMPSLYYNKLYQVTPQGMVSTYTLTTVQRTAGIDVDASGNVLLIGSCATVSNCLVSRSLSGQETVLWGNGLNSPAALVKDDAGNYVVTNTGDGTLAKVSGSTGAVSPFLSGLSAPHGITRDAAGNFYVANSGANNIIRVTSTGQTSVYATGLSYPFDLRFDSSGNLFVSNNTDNSIVKVLVDGSVQPFAKGIANGPEGMKYDSVGNLWIANDDGTLRKKDSQDAVTVVATGLSGPHGVAIDSNNNIFVANYNNGSVTQTNGTGTVPFATALANPYGVALDGSNNLYVTERGANRISVYSGTGTKQAPIESYLYNPSEVHVDGSGVVYIRNYDSIVSVQAGAAKFLVKGFNATAIAVDPVNGGIVAITGYDVYRIAADGTKTHLNTTSLPFYPYGVGVNAAGSVLLEDYSGKRLVAMNGTGTLTTFATLSTYPGTYSLLTDLSGNAYIQLNGVVNSISAAGVATPIPVNVNGEYVYGYNIDAGGKLLAWTNYNHLYAVDPTSGAGMQIASGIGYNIPVTRDAVGQIYAVDSSNQELRTYDSTGKLTTTLPGFTSPADIVWTGSDFRFVDNGGRVFSLTPGGYPTKLGSGFGVFYLAWQSGQLLGGYYGSLLQWSSAGAKGIANVNGFYFNGGLALRADGALTAADNRASHVVTLDTTERVIADYAGIVGPQGLSFDSLGQLYVSNYGASTIARFAAGAATPSVFSSAISSPTYLSISSSGTLAVSTSGSVYTVNTSTGTAASLGNIHLNGTFSDGSKLIGADGSSSVLRSWDGTNWNVIASGLSSPSAIRVSNGNIYVANSGNSTLVAYANGMLTNVASNVGTIYSMDAAANGSLLLAGSQGLVETATTDGTGTLSVYSVAKALNNFSVYGARVNPSNSTINVLTEGYSGGTVDSLAVITVSQPVTPPAPGTVVYQTTIPMPAMPAIDGYTHLNLGSWLPPYGGDFQITISRPDVPGSATNFVHVGPSANGALSLLTPTLPPGDQTAHMCMNLTGADFTSISRVETSQVRPLVSIARPNGMAGDLQGNLYFTDSSNLYKVDTSGVTSTVATGLNTRFGLAADSKGQMYFASYNNTKSNYDLIRVDTTGKQSTVTNLGVNQTNGIAVDSHDNVLVGSPGQLLKVNQQGNISTVTRQGLPQPRGIAIDGRDDVYVQNEGNYISMIKPDGSVVDIFTKGDGVTDPAFEGDGYPNIAADCADNFYIAPFQWAKLGQNVQVGEEQTLAQVIPRTGQVSLLFQTTQIDPSFYDIDYISFDRLNNRILIWNDNQQKVWQVPVTCGAINVQAQLVTQPGQTLTGMTVPPSAQIPQTGGGTEYVWSLKDVTASGQQVCFDTNLTGLKLGEQRQTLNSGFITFQNSFAPNDVKVPLDIPSVQVNNIVQIGVTTDQPDYPANATAQVTTTLSNLNAVAVSGALVVDIYDALGVRVGGVTQQDVNIPSNGTLPVAGSFAIGTVLPAQYTVKASLTNNGNLVAQASTTFNVLPDNVSASATSTVNTDKQTYNPSDSVVINSRAISQSANIILSNLTLMVKVYDAGGTLQFTHGYSIAQLLPETFQDFSVQEKLTNAAPGSYTVKQDLLDSQGNVYNHVETTYVVSSTSDTGFGLVGTISVTPKSLPIGQTLTLTASATNKGNGALSNVPLTISIIDPSQLAALQQFNQTSALAVGASVPFNATWVTQGNVGTTYLAVLTATVGSGASAKNLMLALDTFTLSAPAIHLDASVTISAENPPLAALVLVDANVSTDTTARITAALTALNYTPNFVNTTLDFANGVRSGAYQVYLLLATQVTPDATTLRLLREAVHRGEGVIASNGAAGLPDALAQITGLTASSVLPVINAQALDILSTAPGGAAHIALSPSLASRVVVPTSAQTQATLTGRLPSTPNQGALSDEVANLGRVDIGYYGTDAGTGGTHLSLTSMGRIHNADGTDRYTVWRIRNSGATARSLTLSSGSSYSLAFSMTSYTDTFIASPVVAGTAAHQFSEGSQTIDTQVALTSVFSDTRIVDVGDNPGAIALWANAIDASDVLDWSGAQHQLHGAIHSNSDIQLAGAQNLIDGPVHYVTTFTNNGGQNTFTFQPRQVVAQTLPTLLNLDDFKPGGPVAASLGTQYFDHTTDCAKGSWHLTPKDMPLATGVHWVPCDMQISGNGAGGSATVVATGSIQIDGPSATFKPFYQGVQLATTQTGSDALRLTGNSNQYGGLIFVPHGTVQITGSSMVFQCSIIADQIRLAGAKTQIDTRQCQYATVQRQTPAVLWNNFGGGRTAYSTFDWQSAISQYEATPGPLGGLFNSSLINVAPTSIALRAGTILPLTTTVTNKGDPFKGQLALTANDDSVFMPSTATWPLDFTSQNLFTEKNNVRLGTSSSSTLTATVSATSPIVVNPLKTAASTVAHLPGESISDLIAAVNAISGRDAPLYAALTALQAAQTAMTSGNGEAALSSLLDGAEACGQSTNAQADALRTRIDWVIWAGTH